DRSNQRHAVAGDDLAQAGGARREAGEVDPEPFRQGGVDVSDTAVLVGGKEAGRRVVEVVDSLLQVEEEALLFGALLREVGELPRRQRLPLSGRRKSPGLDAVPARARVGTRLDGLSETELARAGLAVLEPGSQAVDGG